MDKQTTTEEIKGAKLFWRIQRECWRRMVTPYLMYLFMSLFMLVLQAINQETTTPLEIVLGILCLAAGAAFNAHLMYQTGILHYDAYLTGCVHRRNRLFGIVSGGDHRVEREFAPWKGFYIGFLIGVPVLILGLLSYFFYDVASLFFMMFAGWAIIPITWFGTLPEGGLAVSPLYSYLFILLPVIVSGVFYLVGAMVEKRRKQEEAERTERVNEIAEQSKKRKEKR